MGLFGSIVHAVTAPVKAAVHTVEHAASNVVHTVEHAATTAVHAVEHAATGVTHAASSAVHHFGHVASHFTHTALHTVSHAVHTVEHAASTATHALGHGASSAIHSATHWVDHAAHSAIHAGEQVGHLVAHEAKAVGNTLAHAAVDVGHTMAHDATHAFNTMTHGLSTLGHEAGKTVSDFGHAISHGHLAEAGSALVSGGVDMLGTTAGVAGSLAKDYEHAMGNLVTNAVTSVAQIAESEVAVGYGTAGIAAHTVGTPVGDFYANVAKHYGDAAITTLEHVHGAINTAVDKLTHAGGDLMNSLGHGADTLGHDGGKVVTDVGHGDFNAAAHDAGQFGKDTVHATKDVVGAQIEGAEALAAGATAVATTLGALNEAMARAGGGFVSAVGETMGGKAGEGLADAGNWLGDKTAMTADLVQGNLSGAAVEGAKVLGGMAGQWVGDHVKDWSSSLGDKLGGGLLGDGLKALGDAGADAIKSGMTDLAGSAAGKGVDYVKGGDDHAPKADHHDDAATTPAAPHKDESLMEKGQHALDDFVHHQIDKAGDYIQKVAHDPQVLYNQIADMVKDHYGKDTAAMLGKLLGVHPDANADAQGHTPVETSHAIHNPAQELASTVAQTAHDDGHTATVAQPLAVATAENAHVATVEAPTLAPSFGDHTSTAADHAADFQAALQNAMHIFTDAAPHTLSLGGLAGLDAAHDMQSHGAETGIIIVGGHEVTFDHGMPVHAELPMMMDHHFAHQLV